MEICRSAKNPGSKICKSRQRESPMSLILVPKWHGVIVSTPHRKGVVRCKSVNATNKRDGL
jgi:hypothetical protein